jgi:hypothetical protein
MNTLFFNSPSQMTVSEMTGDLPCDATLFEASTADDFQRLCIDAAEDMSRLPSLKEWILSLLQDRWFGDDSSGLPRFEPCHMMISIFG